MKSNFKNLILAFIVIISILISLFFLFKQNAFRDPEPSESRKIIITNKSSQIIYWLLSDYGKFDSNINKYIFDSINLNNHDKIYCNGWSWESVEDNSVDKRICIYIFVQDSINKYTIDKVLENQLYTKKILVDIDYLNKNNWTVIYK